MHDVTFLAPGAKLRRLMNHPQQKESAGTQDDPYAINIQGSVLQAPSIFNLTDNRGRSSLRKNPPRNTSNLGDHRDRLFSETASAAPGNNGIPEAQ